VNLPELADGYGCLVPQVTGRRPVQLMLSEFDQALFDALRQDVWLRPVDLLKRIPRLVDYFDYYGDLLLPRRLWEWGQQLHRECF
jgi:hypothetical protein